VASEEWLSIPVPALVSEELFSVVQGQLQENRQRARQGQRGAKYLLQGLLVCQCCGYAYYGKAISPSARKGNPRDYAYYRCIGSDAHRFGGQRLCENKQVRTDRLEQRVWQEVCQLLAEPKRLAQEYQHRLDVVQRTHDETNLSQLDKQISKVRQGISRLIDGYVEGYLDKAEVEPRIRRFKERLKSLEEHSQNLRLQDQQRMDLKLVIGQMEEFSAKVKSGLENLDWHGQRELIRTLVKRVEIGKEQIKVVFRVGEGPLPGAEDPFLQDCWRGDDTPLGGTGDSRLESPLIDIPGL
jgi:site-specific DNA recombinase